MKHKSSVRMAALITGAGEGIGNAAASSCTRAAQTARVKMLALEFAPQKIRVHVICPGVVETQISDIIPQFDFQTSRSPY